MTDETTAKFRFDTKLREAIEAGADPESAAAAVLLTAPRDDLESALFKWAANRARWISRRIVVNEERRIEAGGGTVAQAVTSGDPVRAMTFYVDGEIVRWDEATADQHEARAAMQRRLAGECVADAVRHEEAARQIREAGVACLAQIGTANQVSSPDVPTRSRASRRKAIAA